MSTDLRKATFLCLLAAVVLMVVPRPATAQNITNATIRGRVLDETGGALPGVTIVATSPALIEGERSSATDIDGNYALRDLPIGVYRVTFELDGFQRFVREQIQLTAGFSATVNVTMTIGALAESITVSGASPVVDATNTTKRVSLSSQELTETIPAQRNYREMVMTAPSVAPAKANLLPSIQATASAYGIREAISSAAVMK